MIQRLLALVCIWTMVFAAQTTPVESAATTRILPVSTLGQGKFQDIAWSSATNTLAIASTMGVWLYPGDTLDAPRLLGSAAYRVAFSPDGDLIVTHSLATKNLMIWRVDTGEKQAEFLVPAEINEVAFAADHQSLFALGDEVLYLIDTSSGKLRGHLAIEAGLLSPLVVSHDGTLLALENAQDKVELWSAVTRKRLVTLPGADRVGVYAISFAPDDKRLFVAYIDGTFETWRGAGATWARDERPQPVQKVVSMALSRDGRVMATWAYGGDPVRLWSVNDGLLSPLESLPSPRPGSSYRWGLTFNADGSRLAGLDGDGNVSIWDVRSQQLMSVLASDVKTGIAFNPAPGDIQFALSRANQVELWTGSGQQMTLRRALGGLDPQQQVGGLAFSLDGKTMFAGSVAMLETPKLGKRARGVVYRWNTDTGQSLDAWVAEKPDNPEGYPSSLHLRPDGSTLAFAFILDSMSCLRLNSYVSVWDTTSGNLLDLRVSYKSTLDAVFSPDSSLMAVHELKDSCVPVASTIDIVETATQTNRARLVLEKPALSIAFSPDGKRFAAVTWDTVNVAANRESTVILWDTSTFQQLASYPIKRIQINPMAFSPDGQFVALGDGEGRLYLLNAASGELAASILAHPSYVRDIVFSPDGSLLATVGAEGSARFWHIVEK